MKKYLLLPGVLIISLILVMCETDSDNNVAPKELSYIKTELGGCNGQTSDDLKSLSNEQKDTVIFITKNDTLDVYVGINYICCAPFVSESIGSNDSIIISISDTCSVSCYCKCMCYYTWDFLFIDYEKKEYPFKIILNDPREAEPIVFKEGIIDLSED
jgi:hypothetical protein